MPDNFPPDEQVLDEIEEELTEEAVEAEKRQPMKIENRSIYAIRDEIAQKGLRNDESES